MIAARQLGPFYGIAIGVCELASWCIILAKGMPLDWGGTALTLHVGPLGSDWLTGSGVKLWFGNALVGGVAFLGIISFALVRRPWASYVSAASLVFWFAFGVWKVIQL